MSNAHDPFDPAARWERVERILDRLFELEGLARERELLRLTEAESGRDELRRELRTLLEADEDRSDEFDRFLEEGAKPLAERALLEKDDTVEDVLPAGGRIGPWVLDRVLGSGGMSVVYLGRREDGEFRQEVAVKVLRHPGRHPELVRRFRMERQILARLRHPHIARIVDGGVAEGGWPYLVMEYVDGVPLQEHCAARHLSIEQRLDLFDRVCDAVHHAHRHLVVHRDLKPSNILVSQSGEVKLLDFGIAKLLEAGEAGFDHTVPFTETGLRLFTADYAAPEQVRGDTITTATDVYALGVLLYELLAGERPYRLKGRRASDIERIVCEEDPAPPSTTAVRTGADDPSATTSIDLAARDRRATLRGDLDTICLKALRKEPTARYASAQELQADLRRYREGLPVSARPATAGYRFSKFVRRNRLAVAAATTVTVLSLAFALVATVQREQTRSARDAAELQARKATELTDFLVGLFRASNPMQDRGDTLTVRDLLERGVERAEAMRDQPLVKAEMLAVMGDAFRHLGRLDRATDLYRESRDLQERQDATDTEAYVATLASLGATSRELGDFDEALVLQQRVLADGLRRHGPRGVVTARAMDALAQTLSELGRTDRAESLATAALEVFETDPAVPEAETLSAMSNLSNVMASGGDFARAAAISEQVVERRRRLLGDDHLDLAVSLHNLAVYSRRLGDSARAEQLYRESIAIKRSQLPDPHPDTARSLDNLGIALGVQGRYDEAEGLFLEALAMRQQLFGEPHPRVAPSYSNLSMLMQRKGDVEGAIDYARRAVGSYRTAYDSPHMNFASALRNLSTALLKTGRFDEAIAAGEESLEQYRALLGDDSAEVAVARGNLGAFHLARGDAVTAERLRREALTIQLRQLGDTHPRVAVTWNGLGDALAAQGRHVEADSAYAHALSVHTNVHGAEHPATRRARTVLEEHRRR